MGFGIALAGYAFLLLDIIGGGVFASLLLGYGFFKATRIEKHFLGASVSALFMFPYGLMQLLSAFGVIGIYGVTDSLLPNVFIVPEWLGLLLMLLWRFAWISMSMWLCLTVRSIAVSCKADKLKRLSDFTLYITSAYLLLDTAVTLFPQSGFSELAVFILIAKYVVVAIGIYFVFTCKVLITSEREYEKDKQMLQEEKQKAMQKAEAYDEPKKRRRS